MKTKPKPEAIAQIEAALGGLFPNGMASSWDVFVRKEDAKDAFKAACNPIAMREGVGYFDATLGSDSRLANPKQECPDCSGHGYVAYRADLTTKEPS